MATSSSSQRVVSTCSWMLMPLACPILETWDPSSTCSCKNFKVVWALAAMRMACMKDVSLPSLPASFCSCGIGSALASFCLYTSLPAAAALGPSTRTTAYWHASARHCHELTLLCWLCPSLTACFCYPRHAGFTTPAQQHTAIVCLCCASTTCLTDACHSLLDLLLQTQRVKMRRSQTRTLRLRVRVLRMTMRTAKGPATQMKRMLTST